MKNSIKKVLSSAIILGGILAQAEGPGHGGGGSTVPNPNGDLVVSDPYVDRDAYTPQPVNGTRWKLQGETKSNLEVMKTILDRHGVTSDGFWSQIVFGERVEYWLVPVLPCQEDKLVLEDKNLEKQELNFACTTGTRTYFLESAFQKLSSVQQALGVLHERLHAFFRMDRESHYYIAPFVSSVGQLLALKNVQDAGDRRVLSAEEIRKINELGSLAKAMGFAHSQDDNAKVWAWGGGMVRTTDNYAPEETFVDIASYVSTSSDRPVRNSEIRSSEVLGSIIQNAAIIGSQVKGADVSGTKFGATTIVASVVEGPLLYRQPVGNHFEMPGPKAQIRDSVLSKCRVTEESTLVDSTCEDVRVVNASIFQSVVKQGVAPQDYRGDIVGVKVFSSEITGSFIESFPIDLTPAYSNEKKLVFDRIENSKLSKVKIENPHYSSVKKREDQQLVISQAEINDSEMKDSDVRQAVVNQCFLGYSRMAPNSTCTNSKVQLVELETGATLNNSQIGLGYDLNLGLAFLPVGSWKTVISKEVSVKGLNLSLNVYPEARGAVLGFDFEPGSSVDFSGVGQCRLKFEYSYQADALLRFLPAHKEVISSVEQFQNLCSGK